MLVDKKVLVVLYCNVGDCWKSFKVVIVLIKVGYIKIYWFCGGFLEWKVKGYLVE